MSSSSSPYPNPLNNRLNFKLNAAKIHLETLKRLEDASPGKNLASYKDRMHVEMEIDEFLYHLVGVKDALFQEINCEFHLGLSPDKVTSEKVKTELNQKQGIVAAAKTEFTKEIGKMQFDKQKKNQHPLWLINELHNHSKHRNILPKALVVVDSDISKISLINPRTNRKMKKPIMDYADDSYKIIERWQKNVRKKIIKYHPA
jgi:hypothetical protein